jgi:3'-5' exoribonuclease
MSNPKLPFIRAIAADLSGWAYFLCTQKDVRAGRNGDLFISLLLQDKTGFIKGRVFNEAARLRDEFDAGEFVKVQGRTDLFNGRIQLLVEKIRRINPEQDALNGFREEDCVLCSARPVDEMWSELQDLVQHVRDPFVRELLQRITTEHAEKLRIWPAAQTVHHAYRSGYLEHVLSVARSALVLGTSYGANLDLLTAGALLHDIGKLEELHYDRTTTYTREGNLVGHVTVGRDDGALGDLENSGFFPMSSDTDSSHSHSVASRSQGIWRARRADDDRSDGLVGSRRSRCEDQSGTTGAGRRKRRGFTGYHSRLGRVLWKG